jgi:putative tryptophan/tyrosine transport system substrate-binding protein
VAAVAAARATRSIPILFFGGVVWPVEFGLVDSFAKPGRNVTGFTDHAGAETVTKRLQFLRAIVPNARRLSWLWGSPTTAEDTVSGDQFNPLPLLESTTGVLGFTTRFHALRAPEDIADVFAEIVSWGADAITTGGPTANLAQRQIGELGLHHRLPIAAFHRGYLGSGALLSYAPTQADRRSTFDRSIAYLDRILRGERPADLPVVQPNEYELVINMKAAKVLGLQIPASVLQRADELVQ